jgi:hypothetical protein
VTFGAKALDTRMGDMGGEDAGSIEVPIADLNRDAAARSPTTISDRRQSTVTPSFHAPGSYVP